ncbi:MAG: hypothetical protein LKI25_05160 [Atopobiaceae bacterium]|jgi:hypothetical protein|nr:hypothetical protein [Atopobiaceae bacterium]MCI2173593.1 hypothetical protein [Atopobiaceae bacterium]MCI2207765.1 hypothetical protein [Atopobiaceae bacterium]
MVDADADMDDEKIEMTGAQEEVPRRQATFVRRPQPHRTQPPVNDIEADEAVSTEYTHDSDFTMRRGNPLAGGHAYRKSRSGMPQMQHDLHYGQYLEMPKGSRSIFATREQRMRRRVVTIVIVVAIVAIVVALLVWGLNR